jgi:hypothetical protein
MRLSVCLILLLCGCSSHAVRCDAHLQPINRSATSGASASAAATGSMRGDP